MISIVIISYRKHSNLHSKIEWNIMLVALEYEEIFKIQHFIRGTSTVEKEFFHDHFQFRSTKSKRKKSQFSFLPINSVASNSQHYLKYRLYITGHHIVLYQIIVILLEAKLQPNSPWNEQRQHTVYEECNSKFTGNRTSQISKPLIQPQVAIINLT